MGKGGYCSTDHYLQGEPLSVPWEKQIKNKIVTLSAKTSVMLEVHKAGFGREGHIIRNTEDVV